MHRRSKIMNSFNTSHRQADISPFPGKQSSCVVVNWEDKFRNSKRPPVPPSFPNFRLIYQTEGPLQHESLSQLMLHISAFLTVHGFLPGFLGHQGFKPMISATHQPHVVPAARCTEGTLPLNVQPSN